MKRRSFLQVLAAALAWPLGTIPDRTMSASPFDDLLPQPEVVYLPAPSVVGLPVTLVGSNDASIAFDNDTGEYVLRVFYAARSMRWSEYRTRPCAALIHPGTGEPYVPATLYFNLNNTRDYQVSVQQLPQVLQKTGIPGPRALAVKFVHILPSREVADILTRHEYLARRQT